MKLEFKPEDFFFENAMVITQNKAVELANTKLKQYLKEYGKEIEGWHAGSGHYIGFSEIEAVTSLHAPTQYKATMINIEPIAECTHPNDKVHWNSSRGNLTQTFKCECGAIVKPSSFEEVT